MSHSLSHATYVSSFNCDKHCICFAMPHTSHLWNASSLPFGVSTSYIDEDEDEEEEEDEDEEEEAHASHVTPRKQRKCCPVESAVAAVLFSFGKLPSQLLSACRPPRFVAEVPHISQHKASSSKLRGALRRTSAWPRIVA